jgi:heme/copper-type cytochrome/quinol oxidase subunit 2
MQYGMRQGPAETGNMATSTRNLYVPANVEIQLQINSDDYLYMFSLPDQGIKEIAVPGITRRRNFTVASTGIYPLIGDQLCGYSHPNLIGKLIVQSPVAFRQWLQKQTH